MAATAISAAAAAAASFAYLDAKLHLRKDIQAIQGRKTVQKAISAALRQRRLSLYYRIEEAVQTHGDEDCLWSRSGCFTWNEAYARANQYAQFFLSQGVKPGEFAALIMKNSPDFPLAWIGLWGIGAAPSLINCSLKGEALVHVLKLCTAKFALVDGDADLLSRLADVNPQLQALGIRIVNLDDVRSAIYGSEPRRPPDELRKNVLPDSPMMLFYTSGTTGVPKACPLPMAAGFSNSMGNLLGGYPSKLARERCYVCMPYYHGTGGIIMMAQLTAGTSICIGQKFSVSRFWDDVRDSRATWIIYVGETLRYLLAAPPSPRDKEHCVHSVLGNGLRPDVWHKFKERFGIDTIWEIFASTEGMLMLANPCRGDFGATAVGHHGFLQRWRYHDEIVPVLIDTETGDIARDPETGFAYRVPYELGGEILIKIPGERKFVGYFRDPAATEKKYARDIFEKGDCYYRTGDALRRDGDGRWFFMDRLGDTFRWKGENVSTTEVSEILGRFPGVAEVAVYGAQLPGHDGKAGVAALHLDSALASSFDYAGFLSHARSHLPSYAVPIFLRRLQSSLATHNNKQNKAPLQREGVDPAKVKAGDQLYWIEGRGKGKTYVPFSVKDWTDLTVGRARL